MYRRTARGNRLGLAVTGLLLLASGGALIAAHLNVLPAGSAGQPLYPPSWQRFIDNQAAWLWPVAAGLAIFVGLLYLRWLFVQPRTDRLRHLLVDPDLPDPATDQPGSDQTAGRRIPGRTTLPAAALTDTVADDLAAGPGIRRASAALTGTPDAPQLWLAVTTDADANLDTLLHHVLDDTLPAARHTLDNPDLPAHLTLTVSRHPAGRTIH